MNFTKIFAVVLALITVLSLAACGVGDTGAVTTDAPETTTEAPETTTEAPETTTEAPETTTKAPETTTEAPETTTEPPVAAHPEQDIIDLFGVFGDPTFDNAEASIFEQINAGTGVVEDGQFKVTMDDKNQCYMQTWRFQDQLAPGVYKVYFKATAVGGDIHWAQFCFGPGNTCAGAAQINGTAQVITVTHSNAGGNSLSFGAGGTATGIVFDYIQVVPA